MRTDFKNLLSLLLLLTLPAVVEAQFNYTTNSGTITITRYTDDDAAVIIPSKINGLPVTSIGAYAFSACTFLTNVIIPPSVTSIRDGAFYRCTGLTSVTVPASVTSIAYATFAYCGSLPGVTIPPSVRVIGDYAFLACTSLGSVALPLSVTSLGNEAFENCSGLTNVVIPSSLTSMGYATFYQCTSLASVAIPPGLTSIGSGSFGGCASLTEITVDAPNSSYSSLDGVLFDNSQTTLLQYPGGKPASDYTIPTSVISLGDGAFAFCARLTGVYFQGNAPSPGSSVFDIASNATVYYLPDTSGWSTSYGGRPTTVWRPQVQTGDGSFGVRTNQFGFTITWASGRAVVVEASTNLANPAWYPLQTNTLTGGSSYFSDPQWTNHTRRSYRLRSL